MSFPREPTKEIPTQVLTQIIRLAKEIRETASRSSNRDRADEIKNICEKYRWPSLSGFHAED